MAKQFCENEVEVEDITGLPSFATGKKSGKLCIIYINDMKSSDSITGFPKPCHGVFSPVVWGTTNIGYIMYNPDTQAWIYLINGTNGGWANLVFYTE